MKAFLRSRRASIWPATIFVIVAGLVVGVWSLLRAQEQAWTVGTLNVAADQTEQYLGDFVATRLIAAAYMRDLWNARGNLSEQEFDILAAGIQAHFPSMQAINHTNPLGIIDRVAPKGNGNEAMLGFNVNLSPKAAAALAKARATGRAAATPPLDLRQGGPGFVVYLPLGNPAGSQGFLNVVFRLDKLSRQVWRSSWPGGLSLFIQDGGVPVLALGDTPSTGDLRAIRSVRVVDRLWTVRIDARLASGWAVMRALPLGLGILAAALVAWLTRHALLRDEARHRSEQRFRDYAEAASDWFWETDGEGRYTFISPSGSELLGRPVAGFIGQPMERLLAHVRATLPSGEPLTVDLLRSQFDRPSLYHFHDGAGQRRIVLVRARAHHGARGDFQGYRGTATDLTRETAERERATLAEHRLRGAIESISDGFVLYDEHERLVVCNDRYLELLPPEFRSRMLPGIGFSDVMRGLIEHGYLTPKPEQTVEDLVEERLRLFRDAIGYAEVEIHGGRWLRIGYARTDDGGRVLVSADITEQRMREEALRHSEERYRSLIDGSIQGVMVHRNFEPIFANETAARILGLDNLEELLQLKDIAAFVPPEGRDAFKAQAGLDGLAPGEIRQFSVEAVRSDGQPIWLFVRASRVEWEDGPAVQMTAFDGTSHKRAELNLLAAKEQAEHASTAKSTFLAHMSHELRTPLNAVIGFSEILKSEIMGPIGSPRYREYAQDIWDSGRHLLNLINDILDMSKFEADRLVPQDSVFWPEDAVEACVRMMREGAEAKHVSLTVELAPDLVPVRADLGKIKQILLNLISNALKFTPAEGQVVVSAQIDPGGGLTLCVRDTGIGMRPEDIPRALEPFTQIHGAIGQDQPGTGLGLPLAKAFAEIHGGTLEIESAPGRGTSVSIRLPRERVVYAQAA